MLLRDGTALVGVLLIVFAMPLLAGADSEAGKTRAVSDAHEYVPDQGVRHCVAGLDASQVAGITIDAFYIEGHYAGLLLDDNTNYSTVTDPKLIAKLLRALQHAEERPPVSAGSTGNENPDQLKIMFRPHGGTTRPPILLFCNYTLPARCFGPEFFAVMQDVEQYRAEQVRRFARDRGAQIKSISLDDDIPVSTTEKQRLIDALCWVDGRAFVFTSGSAEDFSPLLTLQDGKQAYVCFRILPSAPSSHEAPPLPSALWSAYLRNKIIDHTPIKGHPE